jgi:hypothetical protein
MQTTTHHFVLARFDELPILWWVVVLTRHLNLKEAPALKRGVNLQYSIINLQLIHRYITDVRRHDFNKIVSYPRHFRCLIGKSINMCEYNTAIGCRYWQNVLFYNTTDSVIFQLVDTNGLNTRIKRDICPSRIKSVDNFYWHSINPQPFFLRRRGQNQTCFWRCGKWD